MFGFRREKEPERYYLFPGNGGRHQRRKKFVILFWSIIVSLIVAGMLAVLMYWLNRPKL
jgi:hypothetical protein